MNNDFSTKQSYLHIFALMLMLHISLIMWKAVCCFVLSLSQPLEIKMATMTGMCCLTAIVIYISRVKKTDMSIWPKKYDAATIAILLLSILMLLSTLVGYKEGAHGL